MEQVNAKRVAIFVVSACLIGMVVGSAVTLAVLNVQRAVRYFVCKALRFFLRNLFRANQNSNHPYSLKEILGAQR